MKQRLIKHEERPDRGHANDTMDKNMTKTLTTIEDNSQNNIKAMEKNLSPSKDQGNQGNQGNKGNKGNRDQGNAQKEVDFINNAISPRVVNLFGEIKQNVNSQNNRYIDVDDGLESPKNNEEFVDIRVPVSKSKRSSPDSKNEHRFGDEHFQVFK